jgi:hypothetical protein
MSGQLRPGRFTPGERSPGTHWIGGWVDPRAGLDDVHKIKLLTLTGTRTSTGLDDLSILQDSSLHYPLSKIILSATDGLMK